MPVSRHILNTWLPPSGRALLGFVVLVEILARDLLFSHVGEFKDEIDHLVLINRRTKLGERIVIVAIVVPDLLLASGHLARARDHRATDFVVSDRDLVLFADLGQHETEPDPAVGDLVVFLLGGLFRGVLIGKRLAAGLHLGLDRIPHQIEFFLDQRWLSSRRSSSMRLTRCRLAPANSATSRSRAASFSFSRDSRPSVLANSSSILVSCGASIKVAVVSNSAGWPASFSLA